MKDCVQSQGPPSTSVWVAHSWSQLQSIRKSDSEMTEPEKVVDAASNVQVCRKQNKDTSEHGLKVHEAGKTFQGIFK